MQISTLEDNFYEMALADDENSISTGFDELDEKMGGLKKGRLYVLGGRPAMGKSTMAFDMALNILAKGKEVVVFCLEMSAIQCVKKMVSILSKKSDLLGTEDVEKEKGVEAAITWLSGKPLLIDDTSGISVDEIRNSEFVDAPEFIVIDNMQLLTTLSGGSFSREDELKDILKELKKLAEEKNTAILLTSPISRECEFRDDNRACLDDFGKYTDVYADVIMAMYREEYYRFDTDKKGITEIDVLKNRDGACRVVEFKWSMDK